MYVCIYVYVYVCIYIYIHLCRYMCIYIYIYAYICIYIFLYTHIHTHEYMCIYISYMCIYICIYTFTCLLLWGPFLMKMRCSRWEIKGSFRDIWGSFAGDMVLFCRRNRACLRETYTSSSRRRC